jgi:hypothetical protein
MIFNRFLKRLSIAVALCAFGASNAQEVQGKSDFWRKVNFGGGLGLGIGGGFTNITLAPGAIYNFNQYVAAGVGLQGSYIGVRNNYDAYVYGGSLMSLFNPLPQVQLSAEIEQVRVNLQSKTAGVTLSDDFWNTALFLGAGYRAGNVTVGVRYNVLHRDDQRVYQEAFMPFVRAFF